MGLAAPRSNTKPILSRRHESFMGMTRSHPERHNPRMTSVPMFRPLAIAGVAAVLLAGCGTPADDYGAPRYPPARGPLEVEILDAWFVSVEGERLARDEFVYRMREDCRAWTAQQRSAPPVWLTWADGVERGRVVRDLIEQLQLAGVRKVRAGS